jgi:hypothetical protein
MGQDSTIGPNRAKDLAIPPVRSRVAPCGPTLFEEIHLTLPSLALI